MVCRDKLEPILDLGRSLRRACTSGLRTRAAGLRGAKLRPAAVPSRNRKFRIQNSGRAAFRDESHSGCSLRSARKFGYELRASAAPPGCGPLGLFQGRNTRLCACIRPRGNAQINLALPSTYLYLWLRRKYSASAKSANFVSILPSAFRIFVTDGAGSHPPLFLRYLPYIHTEP